MKTRTVAWITTFTAALSIMAATNQPDCIDCFEQACCTSALCPACAVDCGVSSEVLSYTVSVRGPGEWEPAAADPQVCYVEFVCLNMPQICSEDNPDEWWCMADYFNPAYFYIPGCAAGSPCPGPDPSVG